MSSEPPVSEPVDPQDDAAPAELAATTEGDHADDGLDLALRAARAAAGSGRRADPKKRRRGAAEGGRRTARGPVSGAHPDERDPQLLDTTVERLVSDRGWELDLRMHALFARWAELVGAEVAAHTTPESFTDGRLVVRTDSTAWATQLKYLAPTIVRRLNEELGHDTVTFLDIAGPTGPSWKKGPRSVRGGRGPRDTYG